MDLTKTRMQLMPKGTSLFTVAGDIVAKEGVKGLYAGAGYGRVARPPGGGPWAAGAGPPANDLTGVSHPYEHPPALAEPATADEARPPAEAFPPMHPAMLAAPYALAAPPLASSKPTLTARSAATVHGTPPSAAESPAASQ